MIKRCLSVFMTSIIVSTFVNAQDTNHCQDVSFPYLSDQGRRDVSEQDLVLQRHAIQNDENITEESLNGFLESSKILYGKTDLRFWNDVLWVASYCFDAGDIKQARTLLRQCLNEQKKVVSPNDKKTIRLFQIMSLELRARIHGAMDNDYKSVNEFKSLSELKKEYYGEASMEYIESLIDVANAYTRYGKSKQAVRYHISALSALCENVKERFRSLDEKGREQYWYSVSPYFEGTLDAAFFSTILDKYHRNLVESAYNTILISKSALLSAAKQGPLYEYVTVSDLQNSIGENDVCVEYFRTRSDNYGALVLKKDWDTPRLVRLPRSFEYQNQITTLEEALPFTPPVYENEDYQEYLHGLSQVIWPEQLIRFFPDKGQGRVYFSTAGELDLCPIECLPLYAPSGGRQIVEQRFDVSRLSSTRELVRKTVHNCGVLSRVSLVGGVNYQIDSADADYYCRMIKACIAKGEEFLRMRDFEYERRLIDGLNANADKDDYSPLPGSLKEVNFVDSLLSNNANVLTGGYAVRFGVEEIFKRASTLLMSTHGYNKVSTNDNDPLSSCGLLIAGADTKDALASKWFSAREISDLDLSGVQLAILASCNSMGDTIKKDGVYGIMRAFKIAGAGSIIVTMWPISDTVASLFSSSFFSKIAEGNSIQDAFLFAREQMRAAEPSPYYWAPFILLDGQQ